MTLDLTDEEAAALARYLRQKLDDERFPFTPWLDPLKAILAKLEPPAPKTGTAPAAAAQPDADARAKTAATVSMVSL
jgi:hypothetical protein